MLLAHYFGTHIFTVKFVYHWPQGGGSYTTENECKVTTDVHGATLVSVTVTSESNKSSMDLDDGSNAALNLPSNPKREQLQEIPRGWLRKIITTGKVADQPKVYYYNTVGKKFSCQEEIDQYFSRLGQTVRPGWYTIFKQETVVQWKMWNVITVNVISQLLWSYFKDSKVIRLMWSKLPISKSSYM